MTARRRRMLLIGLVLAGVIVSVGLALNAFRQNLSYFFSPTEVFAGKAPDHQNFRLGGMVVKGSVKRVPGSLTVNFLVTDFCHTVPVSYTGVLPDLFREGSGVVARGKLAGGGRFTAEEVLAKHDENYMPPDVAKALKKGRAEAGGEAGAAAGEAPGETQCRPVEPTSPTSKTAAPQPTTAAATGAAARTGAAAPTIAAVPAPAAADIDR